MTDAFNDGATNSPERKPRLDGGAFSSLVPYSRGGGSCGRAACARSIVVQELVSRRILHAVGASRRASRLVTYAAVARAGRSAAARSGTGRGRGRSAHAGSATRGAACASSTATGSLREGCRAREHQGGRQTNCSELHRLFLLSVSDREASRGCGARSIGFGVRQPRRRD